jgi:hypothetical protein
MTDNEKAATFIGWREGTMCKAPKKPVDDREFGDVWCPSCNEVFGCGDHDVVCPDMSDPRNYMKALTDDKSFASLALTRDWHNEGWRCELHINNWTPAIQRDRKTAGEAVVAALAALYDAEHPS